MTFVRIIYASYKPPSVHHFVWKNPLSQKTIIQLLVHAITYLEKQIIRIKFFNNEKDHMFLKIALSTFYHVTVLTAPIGQLMAHQSRLELDMLWHPSFLLLFYTMNDKEQLQPCNLKWYIFYNLQILKSLFYHSFTSSFAYIFHSISIERTKHSSRTAYHTL